MIDSVVHVQQYHRGNETIINFITNWNPGSEIISLNSFSIVCSAQAKANTSALMCYTLFICLSYGQIAYRL